MRRCLFPIMKLNDSAWESIFDKYDIINRISKDGEFKISAAQIKEFREPRLMTKFDHKENLPDIFVKNKLSILPITRGDYVISTFEAYKQFDDTGLEKERISIPSHLQSLIPKFIVSEAIALNCANACGILNDFLEDDEILPTVNGRMSSGKFEFQIETISGNRNIQVNNAQIEIDAAYEGINYLSIIEAKRDLSEDFLVRQLYYPYRVWENRITKKVKPIFLVFSNGVFYLYEYQFENKANYNSLKLVKQKNYVIETKIYLSDIENILKEVQIVNEPDISFPQANSMSRIINLIELLSEKSMTKQDITSQYAFESRQTNYYTDACRYLELIEKGKPAPGSPISFSLSKFGLQIMSMNYKERQLAIIKQILKHRIFNEVLKLHLTSGEMPDITTIAELMKKCNLYKIGAESTFKRRASTISGWVNWILGVIDE